jgi:NUMOD3 motif
MRRCVIWDNVELQLLKAYYPFLSRQALLPLFPKRTYQAIQRMASELAIKRGNKGYRHPEEARAKMSAARIGRKLSEEHIAKLRRCKVNESAFNSLTEESAYWIGYLISDGNVCYKKDKKGIPTIALHVKDTDLAHLQKFRDFLHSSYKISRYANKIWANVSYSISFPSQQMANALAKYGFVPRKCFTAEIKGEVENNRHVWRGMIDGDGCLGVYVRKNSNETSRRVPYISITGTKTICLQFRSFLEKEICEPMPPGIFYKKSYLFMLSDHRAVKTIKLLYSDCTIALNRKLQKALEIMEEFQYSTFN